MPSWEDLLSTPYGKATPEQIKRAQEHAYALLKPRETPNRSWASPIADVLHALQGNSMLNRSTLGGYDQRQDEAATRAQMNMELMGRGQQQPPLTTGSLSNPQVAMNAPPTPAPQPEAQMTPDDGSAIPQPSNQIEAPKTDFKLDDYLKGVAGVESSGGKNTTPNKYGYGGPFGLRKGENGLTDANWGQPEAHVGAAVRKTLENVSAFKQQFSRQPTNEELYLMHNQGATGGMAHLGSEPDKPAWKVLQDATNIKENLAKERISAQISSSSDLAKKPIDNITTGEFQKYLADKFNGGWPGGTKAQSAGMMRLGGPTEESATPAGPQGTQIAQNTMVPPALPNAASRINPDTLQKYYAGTHVITPEDKAKTEEMIREGAQPKYRNTFKGPQEYDPMNPGGHAVIPGESNQIMFHAGKLQIPQINTRMPDGSFQTQWLIPGKGLAGIKDLNEFLRQEDAKDTQTVGTAQHSTEHYEKEFNGIQHVADQATDNLPKIQKMRQLAKDDRYYSGPGDNRVLDVKKLLDAAGISPGRAAPTEVFNKLAAGETLNNLTQFEGRGRVLASEFDQLRQSLANGNMTKPAIMELLDMSENLHKRSKEIGSEASEYAKSKSHYGLDKGWDVHLRNWKRNHPTISDEDIKKPAGREKVEDKSGFSKIPEGRHLGRQYREVE